MKHYVYQITNIVNGKYYRGKHSAKSLDNDYMGSGTLIRAAIEKYGVGNFKKTILKTFPTSQEAYDYEAEVVTMKEVKDPMCYNLQVGGKGRQKQFTDEELKEHKHEYYLTNKEQILEKQHEYDQRPEVKEHKRMHDQKPEVKKRRRESSRKYYHKPGVKDRQKETQRIYIQQPEAKARKSEYMRIYYQHKKELSQINHETE